jgi:hypothetical protein
MSKYFVIIFLLFTTPIAASAATLSVRPISANKVRIEVNSDVAYNAISAKLKFDPSVVLIKSLSFDNSFCVMFIENNTDNINGLISVQCGKPNPGQTGKGTVAEIKYERLGNTNLHFDWMEGNHVLANDGMGTELLLETISLTISPRQYELTQTPIVSESFEPQITDIIEDDKSFSSWTGVKILIEESLIKKNLA